MKTALVFEGGASRALFTCGVIDVLLENNIRADYLIGVSAGISYGIDYAAAEGESVHAAAAGTVSRVYSDDMLGATVVIDHGDGISTLYGSLADIDSVKVGASVAKGDVIGTVGKSCALEKNLEPHLHFEVLKDGNPENPDVHFAS